MVQIEDANPGAKESGRSTDSMSGTQANHLPALGDARRVPLRIAQAFPGASDAASDWRRFRPDSLTVTPYPDLRITFERVDVKDEGRYVTWIGRNPNLPGATSARSRLQPIRGLASYRTISTR